MIDPNRVIRTAYYTALNGNISINGTVIRVFDEIAPASSKSPYVILSEQSVSDPQLTKTCQHFETTILISVVTTDYYGKKLADEITEQIYSLVGIFDLSPNFIMQGVNLESDFNRPPEQRPDDTISIVRDVRFRNILTQI